MLKPKGNRFVEKPKGQSEKPSDWERALALTTDITKGTVNLTRALILAVLYQFTHRFDRPEDVTMARTVSEHEAGHLLAAVLLDQPCEEVFVSRQPIVLRALLGKLTKQSIKGEWGYVKITPGEKAPTKESICENLVVALAGSIAEVKLEQNYNRRSELKNYIGGRLTLSQIQQDFSDAILLIQYLVERNYYESISPVEAATMLLRLHIELEDQVFSDEDMQRALMCLSNHVYNNSKVRHPDYTIAGERPPINDRMLELIGKLGIDMEKLKAKIKTFDTYECLIDELEYLRPELFVRSRVKARAFASGPAF